MTPPKDARQDQWWGSLHSEYVVDTTITDLHRLASARGPPLALREAHAGSRK